MAVRKQRKSRRKKNMSNNDLSRRRGTGTDQFGSVVSAFRHAMPPRKQKGGSARDAASVSSSKFGVAWWLIGTGVALLAAQTYHAVWLRTIRKNSEQQTNAVGGGSSDASHNASVAAPQSAINSNNNNKLFGRLRAYHITLRAADGPNTVQVLGKPTSSVGSDPADDNSNAFAADVESGRVSLIVVSGALAHVVKDWRGVVGATATPGQPHVIMTLRLTEPPHVPQLFPSDVRTFQSVNGLVDGGITTPTPFTIFGYAD